MKAIRPSAILSSIGSAAGKFKPYAYLSFFLLLAVIYGFVIVRINMLSNRPVSDAEVSKAVNQSVTPHIDPYALRQLQTLNDNSVNVQSLFKQGRTNPFQE